MAEEGWDVVCGFSGGCAGKWSSVSWALGQDLCPPRLGLLLEMLVKAGRR